MTPARIVSTLLAAAIAYSAPQAVATESDAPAPAVQVATAGPIEAFFQDSVLTARVKLALIDAPDVSAIEIGVRTERGVVLLSGFVDDERVVRRALEIAGRVSGVISVQNHHAIKG